MARIAFSIRADLFNRNELAEDVGHLGQRVALHLQSARNALHGGDTTAKAVREHTRESEQHIAHAGTLRGGKRGSECQHHTVLCAHVLGHAEVVHVAHGGIEDYFRLLETYAVNGGERDAVS